MLFATMFPFRTNDRVCALRMASNTARTFVAHQMQGS